MVLAIPTREHRNDRKLTMEIYIEFYRDAAFEEPFFIGGRKFVYCWGKRSNGRIDNAVYSFAGDVTFSYEYFQSLLGK
jgi:hypothetical protein